MDDWRTPPEIWNPLNDRFQFDLDAAASKENALVANYLSNALVLSDWPGQKIWLNPPYGRMLEPFIYRAAFEAQKTKTVVALIPMRTRARWWHESVIGKAGKVLCVRKRIRFLHPNGRRSKYTLSCDSCIVIWYGVYTGETRLESFQPRLDLELIL